jgi:hypothetical protein
VSTSEAAAITALMSAARAGASSTSSPVFRHPSASRWSFRGGPGVPVPRPPRREQVA